MKNVIAALTLAMVATPTLAEDVTLGEPEHTAQKTCSSLGETAYTLMITRQKGVQMSKLMHHDLSVLWQEMVIEAYDVPRYSGEKYQTRQAEEFRDRYEMMCYRAYKDAAQ